MSDQADPMRRRLLTTKVSSSVSSSIASSVSSSVELVHRSYFVGMADLAADLRLNTSSLLNAKASLIHERQKIPPTWKSNQAPRPPSPVVVILAWKSISTTCHEACFVYLENGQQLSTVEGKETCIHILSEGMVRHHDVFPFSLGFTPITQLRRTADQMALTREMNCTNCCRYLREGIACRIGNLLVLTDWGGHEWVAEASGCITIRRTPALQRIGLLG
jgi:hypothetical protein